MDKKIKVIVDDVELEVSVSEEELAKLTKKERKKTGYERAENNQPYYSIDAQNEVFESREANDSFDSIRYKKCKLSHRQNTCRKQRKSRQVDETVETICCGES